MDSGRAVGSSDQWEKTLEVERPVRMWKINEDRSEEDLCWTSERGQVGETREIESMD